MNRRKKSARIISANPQPRWPLDLAFTLGKATRTVTRKMRTAIVAAGKNLNAVRTSFDRTPVEKFARKKGA
jgi:hypothetical protein